MGVSKLGVVFAFNLLVPQSAVNVLFDFEVLPFMPLCYKGTNPYNMVKPEPGHPQQGPLDRAWRFRLVWLPPPSNDQPPKFLPPAWLGGAAQPLLSPGIPWLTMARVCHGLSWLVIQVVVLPDNKVNGKGHLVWIKSVLPWHRICSLIHSSFQHHYETR